MEDEQGVLYQVYQNGVLKDKKKVSTKLYYKFLNFTNEYTTSHLCQKINLRNLWTYTMSYQRL